MPSKDLIKAYQQTDYVIYESDTSIRIGEIFDVTSLGGKKGAFVTAENPGSVALCNEENKARMEDLIRDIKSKGFKYFEGEGKPRNDEWTPENSIFILDIDKKDALDLASQYEQNAIVWVQKDNPAELVFL